MKKNKLILKKCDLVKILGSDYKGLISVFSDKFGIINAILERHELDEYNLKMFQCLSADTTKLFDISRDVSSGGLGVNEKKNIALISCLVEALERYCMSYIPKEEIIKRKKEDLEINHSFENFYTYTDKQYKTTDKFLNPNTDEIEWTKIYSIKDNEYMYWPASLIYLPFDLNRPVAETSSTGMAASFSLEECILSGLMELIERDALMINFMQRLNPPEIEISSIKGKNKSFIKKISKEYSIKIYRLYTDLDVPVYLSIIYKFENDKIHYGIGACASLDSDYSINKALKESLFTYFYSLNIMDDRQTDPNKIKALYEHFLYYQEDKFKYLLFDSDIVKYKRKKVSYDDLLKNLSVNNINVYYKELTTSDVKDTNIKVVKVVAPGLIDINKSHLYPRLGASRLFDVPSKLGLKSSKNLSKLPHPFP